jgi:hypothetical protein
VLFFKLYRICHFVNSLIDCHCDIQIRCIYVPGTEKYFRFSLANYLNFLENFDKNIFIKHFGFSNEKI